MTTSIPTDPWLVARERYLKTLTDDQKRLFTHASLENVLYTTTAGQRSYQNDSRSVALVTKLKPFPDAVSGYGAALDVYSNACPLIMSPLWGSIRVLLHIASEFQGYFEKLVDMFATIGEALPTFRVYERIFSGHQFLLHALSKVYLDIIKFCMDAKDIFNKAKQKKGLHAIQIRFLWRPFDKQFGEVVESFRRHKENVESQASLSHMIEAAKEREDQLIKRTQEQQENSRQIAVYKELKRRQVLKRLSNIDHESRHRQLRKMRCKNTGIWIFSTKQYMEWIAKNESCCLWCYGIPGSGKSITTTAVVDDLVAGTSGSGSGSGSLVAVYLYCDYSNSSTLKVSGILENFLLQLLSRKSEIPDGIQSMLLAAYDGIRKPDAEELLDILLSVIKLFDKVFFILDGVDECGGRDRAGLLEVIQSIIKPGPATVKLFLASRADLDLTRTLKDCICLPISTDDIAADIEAFVNNIIEAKIASRELVVRNQALVGEILGALVNGAEGMFLWVTFQIEDICEASCDKEIRTVLGNLPVGLAETYARALQKIHTKNPGTTQLTQRIFKWMVCARRPLTIDEIKEAISISPRDKSLDPDKITTDDSRIIRACANLAVFDSDERTVQFVHYSVHEFLLRNPVDKNITDIHFRLSDAEREVGEICLTYLTFSRFGTQVKVHNEASYTNTDFGLLASPLLFKDSWFGGVLFNTWARFRGRKSSQSKLSINWGEYLKQTRHTSPSPEFEQQFRLLSYVIENWTWHTIKFSDTNTKLWSIFKGLALEQQLPFSFRPWGDIETAKDFPYMPMVSWAIDMGHEPLLRLLSEPPRGYSLSGYLEQQVTEGNGSTLLVLALHRSVERGYDACVKVLLETGNVRSHDKVTALHLAAERGYDPCVKLLLEGGADPNATNNLGTALHLAASNGRDEVVKLLLEAGTDPNATSNKGTALHLAAEMGYDPCVKLLLEGGTDPNATNHQDTALHLAVSNGRDEVVKLLLEAGADPNATNNLGTALHLAARNGRDEVVKFLLEAGADPHATSNEGTALHLAASNGRDEVVKLLLEAGADPNATNNGSTALHLAAKRGSDPCVKLLLEGGADPNAMGFHQGTALHLAAERGSYPCVKLLLEGGADPNATNNGSTALHLAAERESDPCVKLLLEGGADPNAMNFYQCTALHLAAERGSYPCVKLLLEGGANPNAKNWDTPLHLAAESGSDACVKLLLQKGAYLTVLDSDRETALDLAVKSRSDACIKILQRDEWR